MIFLVAFLLVSINKVDVAAASETTQFFVDPLEVTDVMPPNEFLITINVTEAPESFSWEISLSWDPDLLELASVEEGDFLHRWMWDEWEEEWVPAYPTALVYTPLDEANLNGEIKVGCSLIGNVPWASGDGWLCTFDFTVETGGLCFLDLFNTKLFDHFWQGSPAPTNYPNVDSFTNVEACLVDWKLKVNHAAGIGIGHKSDVGEPNLLEARANNTGAYDVYVQAMFEILDSAGDLVTIVPSGIVRLAPGEATVVDGYWTADESGIYYITAYLFYGAMYKMIPDGFSRTLSLRVK